MNFPSNIAEGEGRGNDNEFVHFLRIAHGSLREVETQLLIGVRLHYLDWGGAGETLLFLHGMGDTAHIYDELAPKFTNQFRVLGLTRRGHGESEIPETGYDTATLVEDIRQFLDARNIQRALFCMPSRNA